MEDGDTKMEAPSSQEVHEDVVEEEQEVEEVVEDQTIGEPLSQEEIIVVLNQEDAAEASKGENPKPMTLS